MSSLRLAQHFREIHHEHFAEIDSTHAYVLERLEGGEVPGLPWLVTTDHQTAGMGRQGNVWFSKAGTMLQFNLTLAWVPLFDLYSPSLIAGLAVARALEPLTMPPPRLKWPNDLLIAEKKVCGMLAKRIGHAVTFGIGINVTPRESDFPAFADGYFPTSLAAHAAHGTPDRDGVLSAILLQWEEVLAMTPEALHEAIDERCHTIGRRVRVELDGGSILEGVAERLDPPGVLMIRRADGGLVPCWAGHLREVAD